MRKALLQDGQPCQDALQVATDSGESEVQGKDEKNPEDLKLFEDRTTDAG